MNDDCRKHAQLGTDGMKKKSFSMLGTVLGVPLLCRAYQHGLQLILSIIFLFLDLVKRYSPIQGDLAAKLESSEMVKRISIIVDEHNSLKQENKALHVELDALRRDYNELLRKLSHVERELGLTSHTKEVVNLCKLLLTGSLIPVASIFILYSLIDVAILPSS